MRRRSRLPRRPRRRPQSVPAPVRRALRRARHLQEAADYSGAAQIYDRLARSAYARRRLRPGIHMDLEAGRCYLEAGETATARRCALRAARYAQRLRQPGLARPLAEAVTARLSVEDPQVAEAFGAEIRALLGKADFVSEEQSQVSEVRRLPPDCPACHAPLHPDELTWVAEDRVTCPFCGTIVLAE